MLCDSRTTSYDPSSGVVFSQRSDFPYDIDTMMTIKTTILDLDDRSDDRSIEGSLVRDTESAISRKFSKYIPIFIEQFELSELLDLRIERPP